MGNWNTRVDLGASLTPKKLEEILVAAARDVGWRVRVEDKYTKIYQLGSVHEEKEYRATELQLTGTFFPKAKVTIYKNWATTDHFNLDSGFNHDITFATEKTIQQYLQAVHQRVAGYQPPAQS